MKSHLVIVEPDMVRGAIMALLNDDFVPALVAGHDAGDDIRVVWSFLKPGKDAQEISSTIPKGRALASCADLNFSLGRFEREVAEMFGLKLDGHPLQRRLVRHEGWPADWYPMLDAPGEAVWGEPQQDYPFAPVEGPGVYEIPVGPVHAGMIEPGHFRFFVVGETILRMKTRLWYVHRGVEKLFQGRSVHDGVALAERISGDSAVAHSLAYCMAVEEALGLHVSPAVARTRAVLLELERLYNHVGDLGMLGNDVGFGIANIHAGRIREKLIRHNQQVSGHRLLRGGIGVGTAALRQAPDLALLAEVADEVAELCAIITGHSIAADRFRDTAIVPRATVERLGCLGYVARASGMALDARVDHPIVEIPFEGIAVEETGDVRARFDVRRREVAASIDYIRLLASAGLEVGPLVTGQLPALAGAGLGVVEGWRGRLVHRVEIADDGTVSRLRAVDPSFFNWPALPLALENTIVPDFPLANKSFNQSYAGNDL